MQFGSVKNQLAVRGLLIIRRSNGFIVKSHDHWELDTVETDDLEDAYFQGLKLAGRIDAKRGKH